MKKLFITLVDVPDSRGLRAVRFHLEKPEYIENYNLSLRDKGIFYPFREEYSPNSFVGWWREGYCFSDFFGFESDFSLFVWGKIVTFFKTEDMTKWWPLVCCKCIKIKDFFLEVDISLQINFSEVFQKK